MGSYQNKQRLKAHSQSQANRNDVIKVILEKY